MTAIRYDRPLSVEVSTTGRLLLVMADDLRAQRATTELRSSGHQTDRVRRCTDLAFVLGEGSDPDLVILDVSDCAPEAELAAVRTLVGRVSCPLVAIVSGDGPSPFDVLAEGPDECVVRERELPVEELDRAARRVLARSLGGRSRLDRRREPVPPSCASSGCSGRCPDCDGSTNFARVLAHDLRAPVRTARLHANYVVSSLADTGDELRRFGARLEGSLEHLEEMILSILDFATLATLDTPADPVPLAATIQAAIDHEAADLREAGASVLLDVDDALSVLAQPGQLERVFLNLLGNAVAHADPEFDLVVTIRAAAIEGGRLRVLVADNGVGIPATEADRVFLPLHRLRPRPDGGLGLGLPICRRIVEGFGGTIRVLPADGPGACLEVVLQEAPAT